MRVIQKALTFDDVLLLPAHSRVLPREVSLKPVPTRKLELDNPLVAAAMDTVTEARLAIAMAQEGGIGIIHKNLTPHAQAVEVAKVKRFESGVLRDPMTVSPEMTLREVMALQQQYKISGFPVVKSGKVVGIVTNRDLRFEAELDQPVKSIMTPQRKLVTVREGASREEARALMHRHRLERVLVIDDEFHLMGLVTVKDILKESEHPNACKDAQGKLRVGAAVGVGEGTDERVAALVEAGADVLVVDTAHGHAQGVLDRVKWIKTRYPKVEVVGGHGLPRHGVARRDAAGRRRPLFPGTRDERRQAGARRGGGPRALQGQRAAGHRAADGRRAGEHGLHRMLERRGASYSHPVRRNHRGGHSRVACPRRPDREGSPELPG